MSTLYKQLNNLIGNKPNVVISFGGLNFVNRRGKIVEESSGLDVNQDISSLQRIHNRGGTGASAARDLLKLIKQPQPQITFEQAQSAFQNKFNAPGTVRESSSSSFRRTSPDRFPTAATRSSFGTGTGKNPLITSGQSLSPATGAFKDSSAYKALSADERELVDMAFSTFSGTEEEQRIFSDALRQATEMADPYAKAQLALFRGEYESKIAYSKGDLERASEIITRTRDELSQDVSSAKEFLSLQEQAEIAQETTKYDEDLLTIADQAAEKGITFSTGARSRALAEERRGAQFQDVIQSGRREFNFRTKELELKASRGDIDAQKRLADLRAKSSFQLEDIGRSAEKVLGSTNVPGGTGYNPTGGVLGSIEQSRRESVIDLASMGLPG